jgi:polar amino acid transport system substrate-binding protein
VDLVARAFTMNCSRWNDIAFSAVYLNAGQKLMVPAESQIDSVDDLSGLKVCAPRGSTSLRNITELNPQAEAVGVDSHTDCIVALQQGQVDAITGDDAILAGFSDQDPGTKVVGEALSEEPYGLGVNKDHPDFAAFVNSALDEARTGGAWQASYDRWLRPALGARTPPRAEYGRS